MRLILLLFTIVFSLSSCHPELNKITYSKSKICNQIDCLNIIANYPTRQEEKIWRAKAKVLLAKKVGDTIYIHFAGGIMTGFSLDVKIVNNCFFGVLENYSCTYRERLKIDLKELVLENPNYQVNDTIIGKINLTATYENKEFSSGEVFISGCFGARLRSEDITYEDLDYEARLAKFENLIKNPSKVQNFLDLRGLRLTQFPKNIEVFKYVDSIDIGGNYLKDIDVGEIEKFKNLKYLDISYNDITYIPNDINKLNRLEYLNVEGNQIESLPDEFFELTHLEELYLEVHHLSVFPKSIQKLKKLKSLSISGDQFKEIPYELTLLPRLQELYVPDSLEYLPVELIDKMSYFYYIESDFPLLRNRKEVMERIAKLPPPKFE